MAAGENPETVTKAVTPDEAGMRLDKLLASLPEVGSRNVAQRLIAAGMVTVDGAGRGKNYQVRAGESVAARLPGADTGGLEPEPMDLVIPFEDEHLLVVDKPAGIVSHPARGHDSGTLVHGLLAHRIAGGDRPERPGIVHRLDKDTSGLMIVAKDEAAHRLLAEMLARHDVERIYLALVHGSFETRSGTIEAPIGRDASDRKQMSVAARKGREAVTHFRVISSWAGAESSARGAAAAGYSLLEIKLETGRTHQIRVHLEAIGHPVAGDSTYGRRKDALGIGRQFLHAARLRFDHPMTGEAIDIESQLPDDLKAALARLGSGRVSEA